MKFLKQVVLLGCMYGVLACGEVLYKTGFSEPSDLSPWQFRHLGKIVTLGGVRCLEITSADDRGVTCTSLPLDVKKIAGRRVTVTADIKRDLSLPSVRWQGGKFQFSIEGPGYSDWPGVLMHKPKSDWQTLSFTTDIPVDVTRVGLSLGVQNASGKIWYRNLKIEVGDWTPSLRGVANMGFKDKVARDGKGGWSDQGSENDAGNLNYKQTRFANIPFNVTHPERNKGKSIVTFQSAGFPSGPVDVTLDLSPNPADAKYVYLLHSSTFAYGIKSKLAELEAVDVSGRRVRLDIVGQRDLSDWWNPKNWPNGVTAALWQNRSGGEVGLYASKFALPADFGRVKSVTLRRAIDKVTWIVVGVTLSKTNYAFPEKLKHTVVANEEWRPLPLPETPHVIPRSALDLSQVFDHAEAGTYGRVIVNKDGHFAFEKRPDVPVRFTSAVYANGLLYGHQGEQCQLRTKRQSEELAMELRRLGYNMVRFHYIDSSLLRGSTRDYSFNPVGLDRFDYFVFCLKRQGIYVNVDFMASRIGWAHGYSWSAAEGDMRRFKTDIYFNPEVRKNWETGVKTFLEHVNPYTGLAYKDDPVLAVAVNYNEQEFGWGSPTISQGQGEWIAFLKKRYKTIEGLRAAWGKELVPASITDFSKLPVLTVAQTQENTPRGVDLGRFIEMKDHEMAVWYETTARKLGFKGPTGTHTMSHLLRSIVSRRANSMIALNNYYAHPFSNAMPVESGIARGAKLITGFIGVREWGKPMLSTEMGHAFWNPYRFEQGLVVGGYAAFQGLDGISPFGGSVYIERNVMPIGTFQIRHDAILKSQEFLSAFLYRRGDVKRADKSLRVQVDPEGVFATKMHLDTINSDQLLLSLVTGFGYDVDKRVKPRRNEAVISAAGGSSVVIRPVGVGGYTESVQAKEGIFDLKDAYRQLKAVGLIPADNTSKVEAGRFVSCTGELVMDMKAHFMSVNTPRFQGACGESGLSVALRDFRIEGTSIPCNVSLVTLENDKTLADSRRMVLVIATNLLNTDMTFEDSSMKTMISLGKPPHLLRTGRFRGSLRNANAGSLKLYALGLNGARLAELPLKRRADVVQFDIDTAKIPFGPSIYFELVAE